jgi:nitroreductase
MEVYEAMRCAPTTRRFRTEPVPRETILRVLDNARFAPSGGNRQGWRVVAVEDPRTRAALGDLYLPHWEAYLRAMGVALPLDPVPADSGRPGALHAADQFARGLRDVPLHLVVCVELAALAIVDAGLNRPSVVAGASVYPFVQNLLLGLRTEGLGAALTTLLAPAEPEVKQLLAIPDGVALAAYVLVGHRAEPWPTRLSRRPVEQFAFAERYGEPLG